MLMRLRFNDFSQCTATIYENRNGGEGNYDYSGSPDADFGATNCCHWMWCAADVNSFGFRLVHSDGSQEQTATVTQPYPTNYTKARAHYTKIHPTAPCLWFGCGVILAMQAKITRLSRAARGRHLHAGVGKRCKTADDVKNPAWRARVGISYNWAAVKIPAAYLFALVDRTH